MNKKENNIYFTATEFLLVITNSVSLCFVSWQYTKLNTQNLMLNEFSLKLADLQNSLTNLEQKMLLEKQEMLLAEKVVAGKSELFISSGLYKWCAYVFLLIIAYYLSYYLYAKFLNVSVWTFLPKIAVPYKFFPFLEKKEFFEFILGEFTIRLKVKNGNIVLSEAKHISDMVYSPLEDLLHTKPDFSKEVINETSSLFLDAETAISTVNHMETLSSVFSVI